MLSSEPAAAIDQLGKSVHSPWTVYSACIPTYTYIDTGIFSKQLMKHMLLILLNVYMSIKYAFGGMLFGDLLAKSMQVTAIVSQNSSNC